MYVVTTQMVARRGMKEALRHNALINARLSLEREGGCRRLDVCAAADEDAKIFLYGVYDDEAAFDAHRNSPHYRDFAKASEPLMLAKTMRAFHMLEGADDLAPVRR